MPAEVQTVPSRVKMRLPSTLTRGNRRCSRAAYCQCVVTRGPSSSPAFARVKAPVQTLAVRRTAGAQAATISASSEGPAAHWRDPPPITSRVSKTASPAGSVSTSTPEELRTAPPCRDTTRSR